MSALKEEISFYSELYKKDRNIVSVYFGGGTPSLMQPHYISSIIDCVAAKFKVSSTAEVTLETNPGTVDINKLRDFRNAGINRISFGVQSFNEKELTFLTRIHDKQTAIDSVNDAYKSGFNNISIDLIFNLPGQTKEIWKNNLSLAANLPVKHISAYSLILERGTILNKMVLDGKVILQDDDYDADLYETTIDFMEDNGFKQYEVSNFAVPGFECIHNNAYWNYSDYFGFGTSAHSFLEGKRWWNFSSLKKYISEINKTGYAVAGSEQLNDEQKLNEYIMLALRSSGLYIHEFVEKFGTEWLQNNRAILNEFADKNLMIYDEKKLFLTKKGYAVCDEILAQLL